MRKNTFFVTLVVMAGLVQAASLVGYWDFDTKYLDGTRLFADDVSGVAPKVPLWVRTGGQIVFDTDRNSYVLDPRSASNAGTGAGGAIGLNPLTGLPYDITKMNATQGFALSVWVKPRLEYPAGTPIPLGNLNQGCDEQHYLIAGHTAGSGHRLFSMNSGSFYACQETDPFTGWNPIQVWRGSSWNPTFGPDNNNDGYGDYWDGTGPWHHLVVTSDGSYYYTYVDGVERVPSDNEHWSSDPNNPLYDPLSPTRIPVIGSGFLPFGSDQAWGIARDSNGSGTTHKVDDVAFFNGYLPPASVAGLYNKTYTPFTVPVVDRPRYVPVCNDVHPGDPNLVAWYHFEAQGAGGAGTTNDLSAAFPAVDGVFMQGAATTFDNAATPFQPSLTVGNVLVSSDPDPNDDPAVATNGTYVAADGDKFDDVAMLNGTPGEYGVAYGTGGFTITAWINPVDLHDNSGAGRPWGVIATKGGYDGSYIFYYENGGLHGLVNSDDPFDSTRADSAGGKVAPGRWAHVAMVFDRAGNILVGLDPNNFNDLAPNNIRFYVDGKELTNSGTAEIWGNIKSVPYPFTISAPGGNVASPDPNTTPDLVTRTFRGAIDDVRLYNKVLTDEEIACVAYRNCVSRVVPDYAGNDCKANMDDIGALSAGWKSTYNMPQLLDLAEVWLRDDLIYPVY